MNYSDLTPEQLKMAEGKSPQELLKLAQEEGIELTDKQLETVAGGGVWDSDPYYVVYCCNKQIKVPEGKTSVTCPECGKIIWV